MDDLGTLDACKANDLKGSNGNALPPAGQLMEPSFAKAEAVHSNFARARRRRHTYLSSTATPHMGMDTFCNHPGRRTFC